MKMAWNESETGPGSNLYQEFPPITIGGPSGDYFFKCPVPSARWAEFAIDSIVNGDGGTGAVVVSGNSIPKAFDYSGSSVIKLTDDAASYGIPIRVGATLTQPINSDYVRITNSERKVFVRIDAAASTSMYVTLRLRARILERIPGPSKEVHPDHPENMSKLRADTINQRLDAAGIPKYALEQNKGAKD